MASAAITTHSIHAWSPMAMSRPIDRLPLHRVGGEHRELMNCKSCRKRKVKCNRLTPKCEACQVFDCPCIYDAVPKKRGPKTDVLDSLVKRVHGLEQIMKDERQQQQQPQQQEQEHHPRESFRPATDGVDLLTAPIDGARPGYLQPFEPNKSATPLLKSQSVLPRLPTAIAHEATSEHAVPAEDILNKYFSHLHGSPYYILDELATRQRLACGRLPRSIILAIYAVTIRFAVHHTQAYESAIQASRDYALQARAEIDIDDPSIDNLQALLLLSMASLQCGMGKKSYMLLSHAISIAFALDLHRELPANLQVPTAEQEGRRKLFWTCYIMDRFAAAGSTRPPMIADEFVLVRLPAKESSNFHTKPVGQYFLESPQIEVSACGEGAVYESSISSLIKIVRILGIASQYLAVGGTKTDSHFPWNAQSNLSKIRAKLDSWHESIQDSSISENPLYSGRDGSVMLLAKLVYHSIHCLIYRPFLPVDFEEAQAHFMPYSWQIEATNAVFGHANAIIELAECAQNTDHVDCSAFAAFCVCTAGTVHVHGAHYADLEGGHAFGGSNEYLVRGAARLEELRYIWANADRQRDTLRTVRVAHKQLMQAVARGSLSAAAIFQMDNFFDRYVDCGVDGSYISLTEMSAPKARQGSVSDQWQHNPSISTPSGHSHVTDATTTIPHLEQSPALVRTTTGDSLQSHMSHPQEYMSAGQHDHSFSNHQLCTDQMDGLTASYLERLPMQQGPTSGGPFPYSGHVGEVYASMPPATCTISNGEDARHDSLFDNEGRSPNHDPFLGLLESLAYNGEFSINPEAPGTDMDYYLGDPR